MTRPILFLGLLAVAIQSDAHHSAAVNYLTNETVEIEGVVTSLRWANPHTHYTVAVSEGDETVEYLIEAGGISELRSRGLEPDFLKPGDRVRVAGLPSRHGRPEIFGHNLLLPNGEEVLFDVVAKPRWQTDLLDPKYDDEVAEAARRTANGIFRVWSTVLDDPDSFPMFKGDYPLTEAARAIRNGRRPEDYPYTGCFPKPMPHIMVSPTPMEILQDGGDILIRIEEYDTERRILMSSAAQTGPEAATSLGTSRGHWEGDVLVVETTNIKPGYFHSDGSPQSSEISLVERFVPREGGQRLDYTVEITDPQSFEAPFELSRYWVWRPEVQLREFDCQE